MGYGSIHWTGISISPASTIFPGVSTINTIGGHMKTIELQCDECGIKFLRSLKEHKRSLKVGRRNFCRLSCATKNNVRIRMERGEVFKIPKEFLKGNPWNRGRANPFTEILHRIRSRLVRRGKTIEYCLTSSDAKEVWDKQGGICPYTGVKLILPSHKTYKKDIYLASIDRIDSSKGYSKENIQFVSVMANYAKNDFSHYDMLEFCKIVSNHWKDRI